MHRVGWSLLGTALVAACSNIGGGGGGGGTYYMLQLVVNGLSSPLYLTAAPGDTAREFVVEQTGTIRIIQHGSLRASPFLDVTSQISYDGQERGLLSVAFAPDYATSGHFFIDYTDTAGNIEVMRYTVSGDPNVADPATADTVLEIDHHTYANHNGGLLLFGPDGYLYIGTGDGGSGGDPLGNGQDSTKLLGKILRLDVSALPYTIPAGNPFKTRSPARAEIWDYGIRNPWRFSFDRVTHDFYIGDVGQNAYEEVDREASGDPGGHNYGWNVMEGTHCYPSGAPCAPPGMTPPILDYSHADGCAIIGGFVYRGSLAPGLQGHYLYADLCSGFIRSFQWAGGVTNQVDLTSMLGARVGVTSFGEDARGELYIVVGDGAVYRLVAVPAIG